MSRLLKHGTPERTKSYVLPGTAGGRVLLLSLVAGAALALGVTLLHFAGLLRIASPGPLASGHARMDVRCEQCHAQRFAKDLRCERCHDGAGLGEWRVEAHQRFGRTASALPAKAERTGIPEMRCAECHDDHRGRGFNLKRVEDGQCATCHREDAPSFARHVEFAVVKSKKTPSRGIKISHERHVREALARLLSKKKADELTADEKARGLSGAALQKTCESCHVATSDLRGFEPIDFDRHCVACHTTEGSVGNTDPVNLVDVIPVDRIPAAWAPSMASHFQARRDRIAKTTLLHEDPWVLLNLARLRRDVDPAGYLADLTRLNADLWAAQRRGRSFPLARAADGDLAARVLAVDLEIAALAKRVAATMTAAPSVAASGDTAGDRKALVESVTAFGAAAGDVEALKPALASAAARAAGEPFAAGESFAALSGAEAAARRAELLAVLETVRDKAALSGNMVLGRRADELHRQVTEWKPGSAGTADLARSLKERRDERARLLDEIDFRKAVKDGFALPVSRVSDRKRVEARADEARSQLTALSALDAIPMTLLDDAGRAARLETANALTAPCRKCHEMTSAAFAPIDIEKPVFPGSFFDHKPHVKSRSCADCHAAGGKGVLTSKSAQDVLVPDVASCRTCHKRSEVRADCATCHKFHPGDNRTRPDTRHPATALVAEAR